MEIEGLGSSGGEDVGVAALINYTKWNHQNQVQWLLSINFSQLDLWTTGENEA